MMNIGSLQFDRQILWWTGIWACKILVRSVVFQCSDTDIHNLYRILQIYTPTCWLGGAGLVGSGTATGAPGLGQRLASSRLSEAGRRLSRDGPEPPATG